MYLYYGQWVWRFVVLVFYNCNSFLFGSGWTFFIGTTKDSLPYMLFNCGANGGLVDGLGGFVGCWGFSRACMRACVRTRVFFIIIFNYYNILLLEFFTLGKASI